MINKKIFLKKILTTASMLAISLSATDAMAAIIRDINIGGEQELKTDNILFNGWQKGDSLKFQQDNTTLQTTEAIKGVDVIDVNGKDNLFLNVNRETALSLNSVIDNSGNDKKLGITLEEDSDFELNGADNDFQALKSIEATGDNNGNLVLKKVNAIFDVGKVDAKLNQVILKNLNGGMNTALKNEVHANEIYLKDGSHLKIDDKIKADQITTSIDSALVIDGSDSTLISNVGKASSFANIEFHSNDILTIEDGKEIYANTTTKGDSEGVVKTIGNAIIGGSMGEANNLLSKFEMTGKSGDNVTIAEGLNHIYAEQVTQTSINLTLTQDLTIEQYTADNVSIALATHDLIFGGKAIFNGKNKVILEVDGDSLGKIISKKPIKLGEGATLEVQINIINPLTTGKEITFINIDAAQGDDAYDEINSAVIFVLPKGWSTTDTVGKVRFSPDAALDPNALFVFEEGDTIAQIDDDTSVSLKKIDVNGKDNVGVNIEANVYLSLNSVVNDSLMESDSKLEVNLENNSVLELNGTNDDYKALGDITRTIKDDEEEFVELILNNVNAVSNIGEHDTKLDKVTLTNLNGGVNTALKNEVHANEIYLKDGSHLKIDDKIKADKITTSSDSALVIDSSNATLTSNIGHSYEPSQIEFYSNHILTIKDGKEIYANTTTKVNDTGKVKTVGNATIGGSMGEKNNILSKFEMTGSVDDKVIIDDRRGEIYVKEIVHNDVTLELSNDLVIHGMYTATDARLILGVNTLTNRVPNFNGKNIIEVDVDGINVGKINNIVLGSSSGGAVVEIKVNVITAPTFDQEITFINTGINKGHKYYNDMNALVKFILPEGWSTTDTVGIVKFTAMIPTDSPSAPPPFEALDMASAASPPEAAESISAAKQNIDTESDDAFGGVGEWMTKMEEEAADPSNVGSPDRSDTESDDEFKDVGDGVTTMEEEATAEIPPVPAISFTEWAKNKTEASKKEKEDIAKAQEEEIVAIQGSTQHYVPYSAPVADEVQKPELKHNRDYVQEIFTSTSTREEISFNLMAPEIISVISEEHNIDESRFRYMVQHNQITSQSSMNENIATIKVEKEREDQQHLSHAHTSEVIPIAIENITSRMSSLSLPMMAAPTISPVSAPVPALSDMSSISAPASASDSSGAIGASTSSAATSDGGGESASGSTATPATGVVDANGTDESNDIELEAAAAGIAAGDAYERFGVWAQIVGGVGMQKARKGASGFASNMVGGMIGADTMVSDRAMIGLAFGNMHNNVKFKNKQTGDKSKSSSWIFSAYGQQQLENNWFVRGSAIYTKTAVDNRDIRIIGANKKGIAQAKYNIHSFGGEATVGKSITMQNGVVVTPSIGARVTHTNKISYEETGNTGLNQKITQDASNVAQGIVGLQVMKMFERNETIITPEAHANIQYGLGVKTPKGTYKSQIDSNVVSYTGLKPSRVSSTIGVGVTIESGSVECGISYDANIAPGYLGHQGSLKLKVKF